MPIIHRIGPAHSALSVAVIVLLLAGCLGVAWVRLGRDEQAKGQRGRLREFGWCAALVVVAAMVAAAVRARPGWGDTWPAILACLVAACVLLLTPRLAAGTVPVYLMLLGLTGMLLARDPGYSSYWYGLAHVPAGRAEPVVVPALGWAFFLLGGWLAMRQLDRHPQAARLILGRMADIERPAQRYGLLLIVASVVTAGLVSSASWFVLLAVLLAGSMLVIRRSPELAARLAAAALIVLGLIGLLMAHRWANNVSALLGDARIYAAVDPSSPARAAAVDAEALIMLGLGGWLVPRAFPEVRGFLGLPPDAEVARRLQRVTESRAVAVDTAAADLRRLERDLHDGAQARLVALGMNLRAAERLIHTSPDAAAALVSEAREASARALTELRELVRGVHPPVLADRGLADAVRALALDSPLYVETELDLPGRLPAPIETACYFAVAELLTNAAKHSGARDARIALSHARGMLRVEVMDFGLGGADPARGSGLAGVEKRLATFDGILAISSPVGGPTVIVLEVPCALSSPKISSC